MLFNFEGFSKDFDVYLNLKLMEIKKISIERSYKEHRSLSGDQ